MTIEGMTMKARGRCRGRLRLLFVYCSLLITALACCAEAFGQGGPRRCDKVPAGNWSASFRPYAGPGRESAPYQIISMNLEVCNGYLYMGDVGLRVPPDRTFGVIEYTAFVYKAAEPDKPGFQLKVFRMVSTNI